MNQGCSPYKSTDLDETPELAFSGPVRITAIHAINLGESPRYLKFYNAAAVDSVTVGTTVSAWTCAVPSAGNTNGGGFTLAIPGGLYFSLGVVIAATTAAGDDDTGAPEINEIVVNLALDG